MILILKKLYFNLKSRILYLNPWLESKTRFLNPKPFLHRFGCPFVSFWPPFWEEQFEKSNPEPPIKTDSFFNRLFDRFRLRFGSLLEDLFVPRPPWNRSKSASGPVLSLMYSFGRHFGWFGRHFGRFGRHVWSIWVPKKHKNEHIFGPWAAHPRQLNHIAAADAWHGQRPNSSLFYLDRCTTALNTNLRID